MPLIAEPFFANGQLTADIVFCTQGEYEKYMSNDNFHDDINSHRVSSKYLKTYITEKGHELSVIDERPAQSAIGEEDFIQWVHAPTVTIHQTKEVLSKFDLSYHEFIDAYAEHLKTL